MFKCTCNKKKYRLKKLSVFSHSNWSTLKDTHFGQGCQEMGETILI